MYSQITKQKPKFLPIQAFVHSYEIIQFLTLGREKKFTLAETSPESN